MSKRITSHSSAGIGDSAALVFSIAAGSGNHPDRHRRRRPRQGGPEPRDRGRQVANVHVDPDTTSALTPAARPRGSGQFRCAREEKRGAGWCSRFLGAKYGSRVFSNITLRDRAHDDRQGLPGRVPGGRPGCGPRRRLLSSPDDLKALYTQLVARRVQDVVHRGLRVGTPSWRRRHRRWEGGPDGGLLIGSLPGLWTATARAIETTTSGTSDAWRRWSGSVGLHLAEGLGAADRRRPGQGYGWRPGRSRRRRRADYHRDESVDTREGRRLDRAAGEACSRAALRASRDLLRARRRA